jgi:hypothetical protein
MNGTLESYWEEKNLVKIGETWYHLAEVIDPQYIPPLLHKEVEFTFNQEGKKRIVNFIKKAFGESSSQAPTQAKSYSNPKDNFYEKKEQSYLENQKVVSCQWAINAAIEWIKDHNQTCKDADRLTITELRIRDFATILLKIRDDLKNVS